MPNKNISKDNKGITLVEVLVTVGIVGIVLVAVAGFFITSAKSYRKISRETTLQNEAQLAFTQIENLTVNASDGVGLGEGHDGATGNDLFIYNHAESTCEVTHIYREENDLYYCKIPYTKNEGGEYELGADKQDPLLLAEYVTNFVVDMTNFTSNNSIDIQMDFTNRDRKYTSKNTIYMRNQLAKMISGSAADYFNRSLTEKAVFTDFKLSPTLVYLWPNAMTNNPFTAQVSSDGVNYTSAGGVVWEISSTETEASINRNSGAIKIKNAQEGGGGTITASVASGDNANKTLTATAQYKTKTYDSISLTNFRPTSEDNHKYYIFDLTVTGKYLETDVDMDSTLKLESDTATATYTKNLVQSKQGELKWTITVKRPNNYTGTHFLTASYTLNGVTKSAKGKMEFTAADNEKKSTINKVRLVNGTTYYDSSTTLAASRYGNTTLKMEVLYDGATTWTELDSDEWSITPENGSVRARSTSTGSGYILSAESVKDYAKTVTVDCATTWYTGGQNGSGPTVSLKFSPVTIKLANGAPTTQTSYPVTCGTTEQMSFEISNIEGAGVYILDRSDSQSTSTTRVSVSGKSASVTVPTNYNQKRTFYFGVVDADGNELPNNIYCEVGMIPGNANLFKDTAQNKAENTYIPIVNSSFGQYDPTVGTPSLTTAVTIYTLSKGSILYAATRDTCKYRIKFNGTVYNYANPEYHFSGWVKK